MATAAKLYGLISLEDLLALYNAQNTPIDADTFLEYALALESNDAPFMLINDRNIYWENATEKNWKIIDPIYGYGSWDNLLTLEAAQEGIPLYQLPKEDFLSYLYAPFPLDAPEVVQMQFYLQSQPNPPLLLQEVLLQAKDDQRPLYCLRELQQMGAVFGDLAHRRAFIHRYQQLSEIVRKPVLRGHTEQELMRLPIAKHRKEQHYYAWFCPPTEKEQSIPDDLLMQDMPNYGLSMRRLMEQKAAKKQDPPHRLYDDCYCGSGLLYADCCGKR